MQLSSAIALLFSLAAIPTTLAHASWMVPRQLVPRQLTAVNVTAAGNQTLPKEAPTDLKKPCVCAPSKCPSFLNAKAVSRKIKHYMLSRLT